MKEEHKLDFSDIDDYDEIDEDQQQTLIFCQKHKKYEWHWLPRRESTYPGKKDEED